LKKLAEEVPGTPTIHAASKTSKTPKTPRSIKKVKAEVGVDTAPSKRRS
jgi:hypothetical protein